MTQRYTLTPAQVAALKSLNERVVEVSPAEVAVSALLLPDQAREALAHLEQLGLASSWIPVTGRTGEHLYILTDDGRAVCGALGQFRGVPPVGAIVRVASPPGLSAWFSRQAPPSIQIVAEQQEAARG